MTRDGTTKSGDASGAHDAARAMRYDGRTFSEHYNEMRGGYDDNLSFSHRHNTLVVDALAAQLRLRVDDLFVDLGCGTGQFTFQLHARRPFRRGICVDPARALFQFHHRSDLVEFVEEDAVEFSRRALIVDKVMFKEAIHFVRPSERPLLFANIHRQLRDVESRFVVVTRPVASPYPLFAGASTAWSQNQPDAHEMRSELEGAGFSVAAETLELPMEVSAERYDALLRKRFLSTLNFFTDAELEAGIAELHATRYGGCLRGDTVAWMDRVLFLAASKV